MIATEGWCQEQDQARLSLTHAPPYTRGWFPGSREGSLWQGRAWLLNPLVTESTMGGAWRLDMTYWSYPPSQALWCF